MEMKFCLGFSRYWETKEHNFFFQYLQNIRDDVQLLASKKKRGILTYLECGKKMKNKSVINFQGKIS